MSNQTLPWLADEMRALLSDAALIGPTYTVEVWCGDPSGLPGDEGPWGWALVAEHVPRWALRRALRHLASVGWVDDHSVYVSRED